MNYRLNRQAVLSQAALNDLTMTQLAERAGVHRITLSKALHRERPSEPTLRTVFGLCRALGLPIEEVLKAQDAA